MVLRAGAEFRDRFTVEKKLGEGSFGKTYLAYEKDTGRECVIKRMYIMHEEEFAAFRHEVKVQMEMAAVGIAPLIYDHWIHYDPKFSEDGKLREAKKDEALAIGMIVMERMDGTLFQLKQEWYQEAGGFYRPMMQRLEYHLKNDILPLIDCANREHFITHGDCTSSNVMYVKRGETYRFYLIDWGYSQCFIPYGLSRSPKGIPTMRRHRKQVPFYDAGLLEWDTNAWMHALDIPHPYIRLIPKTEMAHLLKTYAYKEKMRVEGDAWQHYSDQHPLAQQLLATPPGGGSSFKKRHNLQNSMDAAPTEPVSKKIKI